ncbi:ALK tyrosine kinase receptor-like isoform X2 [Pecten maximus]|uniref:ALK tyrosine kinase receptor-like isoform X2 n=1 Tax=Pecten maximus TaxID=6579 RepID=UPI00145820C5|nr:ALK tyrosine kinase receptor-like isoform X2 [Pecten maximus]
MAVKSTTQIIGILYSIQVLVLVSGAVQLNVSISEKYRLSDYSDNNVGDLQYEIRDEISSDTLSVFTGRFLNSATLELEFSFPCPKTTPTKNTDTPPSSTVIATGEVNLLTSGSCIILQLSSNNFSLSYDLQKDITKPSDKMAATCSAQHTFGMIVDTDLFDITDCKSSEEGKDFIEFQLILSQKNEAMEEKTSNSAGLVSAAVSLEPEEFTCNFESECQMEFDSSTMLTWTAGQTLCSIQGLDKYRVFRRVHCEDYDRFIPFVDTTFGVSHGKFGFFLPMNATESTTLSTPIIYGSSAGCTLQMSSWIHRGDIIIVIRTANVTKSVAHFGKNTVFSGQRYWQNISVHIGSVHTPFSIDIVLHSAKGNVAVDDISLLQCGEAEDKEIPPMACGTGYFQCSTCHWLPHSKLCDLIPDCLFGEDEYLSRCYDNQWNGSCSFDNGWCGWETRSPFRTQTQCVFDRANYTDIEKANVDNTHGVVLQLRGKQCSPSEDAVIYREVSALYYTNNTCQLRFSMHNVRQERVGVKLYEMLDTDKVTWMHLPIESIPSKSPKWNHYSATLPVTNGRFALEIWATVFISEDILMDFVSLSPDCFKQESDVHNDTMMFLRVMESERERSGVVLIVLGTITGLVAGLTALSVALIVIRRRRKAVEGPCRKAFSPRKNSSHSSTTTSTTMSCLEDKHTLQDEALLAEDTTSDRQASLNGSICNMTISPYYEWIQESEEMIRNIPRSKIRLVSMIGKGAFGEVFYGLLADVAHLRKELPVAIKTLPSLCSEQTKSEFFFEAIILSKFKHPNIIRFLGISIDDRSMFLILELMEGGDLRTFVRDARPREKGECSSLSTLDLLKLSFDIAKGCQYLESNKFIHRDIAARNCLLTEKGPNRVAKIGDFGMARDILRTNYYRKNGSAMIPVKWMPSEAFMDGVFTSKTDVWAFGVVLWEVFTMGFVPYPGKTNAEVMKYVLGHGRLNQPPLCSGELYELMKKCWKSKPKDRPSFVSIVETMTRIKCEHNNVDSIKLENLSKDPAPFVIDVGGEPEEQCLIENHGNELNNMINSRTCSPGHVSLHSMNTPGSDAIS